MAPERERKREKIIKERRRRRMRKETTLSTGNSWRELDNRRKGVHEQERRIIAKYPKCHITCNHEVQVWENQKILIAIEEKDEILSGPSMARKWKQRTNAKTPWKITPNGKQIVHKTIKTKAFPNLTKINS